MEMGGGLQCSIMAKDAFGNYVAGLNPAIVSPPDPSGGGDGAGTQQVYDGTWDDPNGNLTPDDPDLPAIYKKQGNANVQWRWDVPDQEWKVDTAPE